MNIILYLMNGTAVGIFGMILSASFCDISWTRQKRWIMVGSMAAILLFQGILYLWISPDMIQNLYPVITHLPLALVLCGLSKKYLWVSISILTSYLCCQLRRWLALLAVELCSGGALMQNAVELLITFPLLILLLRFIAPSVRFISHSTTAMQCQFGLIPLLGYCFDYLTRIYTDLLSEGHPVTVEFMSFVCSVAYLVFVVRTSRAERTRSELEQVQSNLNLQISSAVREIKALRESQRKASTYRHDLRHHMQYLLSCIENGCLEQAEGYIGEICSEIEASKVVAFCENEAANLIFSAFAGRAEEDGISIRIRAVIPQNIPVSESDLCVLLSNALENALHACQKQKEKGMVGSIEVSAYEKNSTLFIQFTNSCGEDIVFEQGIPVTNVSGHGIGVRSICAIVERYGGIYSFAADNGRFVLRVSL